MKKLPKKPSALLKLALTDVEAVEAMGNVEFDMSEWIVPADDTGTCQVCIAGAVMLNSLKASYVEDVCSFNSVVPQEFWAIDNFRQGRLMNALEELEISPPSSFPEQYTDNYVYLSLLSENDRQEWKLHMCTIIGMLEAEGL